MKSRAWKTAALAMLSSASLVPTISVTVSAQSTVSAAGARFDGAVVSVRLIERSG